MKNLQTEKKELLDKIILNLNKRIDNFVSMAQKMDEQEKELNFHKEVMSRAKVDRYACVKTLVKLKWKDSKDFTVIHDKKIYRTIYKQKNSTICLEEQCIHLLRLNILKTKKSLHLMKGSIYLDLSLAVTLMDYDVASEDMDAIVKKLSDMGKML